MGDRLCSVSTSNEPRDSSAQVAMVVMATGTYGRFIPPLVTSARRHLQGLARVVVLADAQPLCEGVTWALWGHLDWPFSTLSKFRAVTSYGHLLREFDSILLIDADMLFVGDVEMPHDGGILATRHPYYVDAEIAQLPYERDHASRFAISADEGRHYYCGGVLGGEAAAFLEAVRAMADEVDEELARGHVPIWHDESVWNRYCLDNAPRTIWGPEYCVPEKFAAPDSLILALDKPEYAARMAEESSEAPSQRTRGRWLRARGRAAHYLRQVKR